MKSFIYNLLQFFIRKIKNIYYYKKKTLHRYIINHNVPDTIDKQIRNLNF